MENKKKQPLEYIVFEGSKFTIEWYFDDKGKSLSKDYFEELSDSDQIKALGHTSVFMFLLYGPENNYNKCISKEDR
jgi:hypothetical protein